MRNYVREAVDRYMRRIPGADSARALDPIYSAQFTFMERVLQIVDMAMEDEGVPERSRERVIRTVVCGAPDEYAAHQRMARNEKVVEWVKTHPGPPPSGLLLPNRDRPCA